jgi:hypothetical protein
LLPITTTTVTFVVVVIVVVPIVVVVAMLNVCVVDWGRPLSLPHRLLLPPTTPTSFGFFVSPSFL